MLPQQAALARRRARENIRIKAEIHKRNKALRNPAVGVVDLDRMQSIVGQSFKQRPVVPHQPEHQLATRHDPCVNAGLLEVLDFSARGEGPSVTQTFPREATA